MAMLAKAWGGSPSLAPKEKVGEVVLSCCQPSFQQYKDRLTG